MKQREPPLVTVHSTFGNSAFYLNFSSNALLCLQLYCSFSKTVFILFIFCRFLFLSYLFSAVFWKSLKQLFWNGRKFLLLFCKWGCLTELILDGIEVLRKNSSNKAIFFLNPLMHNVPKWSDVNILHQMLQDF